MVALRDYKKVEASMFEAVVDLHNLVDNQASKLKVLVTQKPAFTKITRIKPAKVEYIIYK